MRYKLNENQMRTVVNALDAYSRVWMGQYDHLLFEIRWRCYSDQFCVKEHQIEVMLKDLRNMVLPDLSYLGFYGSYGIFSEDIDYRAAVAYNMQQEFRYRLAWTKHPEGGMTVDFGKPLYAERDPYEWPTCICRNENDKIECEINIQEEQVSVLRDAVTVWDGLLKADLDTVFGVYLTDPTILEHVHQIQEILNEVRPDVKSQDNEEIAEIKKIFQ